MNRIFPVWLNAYCGELLPMHFEASCRKALDKPIMFFSVSAALFTFVYPTNYLII